MAERLYYIVSVKHTQREQQYISFWRANNAGYAWPLAWAGKYSHEQVAAELDYYHDGRSTMAIPCEVIEAISAPTIPGTVDNDAGPIIFNNRVNWAAIIACATTWPMSHTPKPQYKGAPRRKE